LRILICHGYLLKGTGSNQYVQSLSRSLCKQGHEVFVMCQESDPALDFVSAFVRENTSGSEPQVVWERETPYPGQCVVYQPDIGGLLPVYVADTYPGFRVKEFTDLDESELDWYVDRNRRAMRRIAAEFSPEAIITNHAVMLPFTARPVAEELGVPYFVCIHGSSIEYTVKRDSRYVGYGAEGLAGARVVFVPSDHTAGQVLDVFADEVPGLEDRIITLAPGVDTDLFAMADVDLPASVETLCEAVAKRTEGVTVGDFRGRRDEGETGWRGALDFEDDVARINALHPDWLPDVDLVDKLTEFAGAGPRFLMFLGKLLETKGIQCVLPTLPFLLRDYPDATLVIVGFGELRGMLELMVGALDDGDMAMLKRLCDYGNANYKLCERPFDPVLDFIDSLEDDDTLSEYIRLCHGLELGSAVIFTGYLTPEEHTNLLPHASAVLMPSLAQEAFGLVATEAMAAGVVPVASYHSGLRTALEPVKEVWGDAAQVLMLDTDGDMVRQITTACETILGMGEAALRDKGAQMRGAVKMRFSWDAFARKMLETIRESD
jgi:glycosyltransferase involved in cell wall biosynthesis